MRISPKFYTLFSHVRHYDWGSRLHGDAKPYIASLLSCTVADDEPWAELWMGSHPSMPSELVVPGEGRVPLNKALAGSDAATAIGAIPSGVHCEDGLPFLLKVLSCEKALSIQSHPDTATAARLHQKDPAHYPDANHKPEVMIALTPFDALADFRPMADILAELKRFDALAPWLAAARRLAGEESAATTPTHRALCASLMEFSAEAINTMLDGLKRDLTQRGGGICDASALCLRLMAMYPGDRGVLYAYLLNHVHLAPGEALYISANRPHAYLFGTGIECMANSDNVIRVGLTPKYVDEQALLDSVNFAATQPARLAGETTADGLTEYITPAKEFRVSFMTGEAVLDLSKRRPVAMICLVLDGRYEFADGADRLVGERGSSWFRPACLTQGTVRPLVPGSRLVLAEVGE